MITLDSSDKYAIIDVTTQAFHLENGVVTLQIDPDEYAIAGRDIYAVFGETGITTGFLSVVDGIIQLPITQGLVVYGYNNFQLYAQVHGTTTVEDFNKMRWLVEASVIGTIPTPTDVDIITDLIAQVTATNNEAADSALEASGYANDASESAAAALLSEQHAATSESNAGLFATAASGSALAASGSATAASNSAIAADNSADAALVSENAAEAAALAATNTLADAQTPATNLITNGDFSNGTTGWFGATVVGGRGYKLATAQWGLMSQSVTTVSGHKYYFAADIEADVGVYVGYMSNGFSLTTSGLQHISRVYGATGASMSFGAGDARVSGWTPIYLDNVLVIDLTAAFGAGNEPNVAQMDAILTQYTNSWFSGTENLFNATLVVKHLITSSDYDITAWGDSITAGGGWTDRLALLSGVTVRNAGTGGENTRVIMARQGGDVMLVNNITIPATTTAVTIETMAGNAGINTALGYKVTPLLQAGTTHVNPVKIGDIEGTLAWTGTEWTFTRSVAGPAVAITRPTAMTTAYDRLYNAGINIIFMGQNGGYTDNADLVHQHKLMIAHSEAKHTIILGLSSGSAADRAEYEAAMKAEFGRYFISLREYLAHPIYSGETIVSCYGLSDAGLTATEADLTAIATGTVPPQLLADSVHYTTATKTVIGNMLYLKMCELGILY